MSIKYSSKILALMMVVLVCAAMFSFEFMNPASQPAYANDNVTVVEETDHPIPLDRTDIYLENTRFVYKGKAIKPSVKIYFYDEDGSHFLSQGEDYTAEYQDNINVGTGKVIITGIGDYTGQITRKFTIVKKSIKGTKITIPSKTVLYTGKRLKPKVKIKYLGEKLVKGRDYSLRYKKNKKIGTACIIVKGKGNYKGTATKKFRILKYFKLRKSQYSKYIQGNVTKGQLAGILNIAMYPDYQTINKQKISRGNFGLSIISLVKRLSSYEIEDDEFDNDSCEIKEINRKLSSFTNYRFKPNTTYYSFTSGYKKMYTDDQHLYVRPDPTYSWVRIISAKRYAKKIEVAFKYGGEHDNYLEWDGYDSYESDRMISEKYVAVLKKQSNGKFKLVKINLKDSYGMKSVTNKKYRKLVKGKLNKKQLQNVINAVMYRCSSWNGKTRIISKKKIRKAGLRKRSKRIYLVVHGTAFGLGGRKGISSIKIKTANRILSSFTTFRYKKNRKYKTNDPLFYAKTNSKRVKINAPTGVECDTRIKSARYNSRKMIVLFTHSVMYGEHFYHYKAILKKDKSRKFKLVRIEKTIPRK